MQASIGVLSGIPIAFLDLNAGIEDQADSLEFENCVNIVTKVNYFDASADRLFVIARSSTCWLY
jgi:hypothetical protein